MSDITFEVKIDFGTFADKKKLTYTSWNGNAPRYDIRDWYDDDKCGKGITFDKAELKSLYEILKTVFNPVEEVVEETTEEVTEEVKDEPVVEDISFMNIEEENKYPTEIQKIFDALDKLFTGYKTERMYGKMPFADGERLQYCVYKDDKLFELKEKDLKDLGVKWFITDKGNLYIYTL